SSMISPKCSRSPGLASRPSRLKTLMRCASINSFIVSPCGRSQRAAALPISADQRSEFADRIVISTVVGLYLLDALSVSFLDICHSFDTPNLSQTHRFDQSSHLRLWHTPCCPVGPSNIKTCAAFRTVSSMTNALLSLRSRLILLILTAIIPAFVLIVDSAGRYREQTAAQI